jgi:hypothetical protein
VAWRVGWGLVLPAVMLVVLLTAGRSRGGWQTGVVYAPDVALLWLGTMVCAFVVGVMRAVAVARSPRGTR